MFKLTLQALAVTAAIVSVSFFTIADQIFVGGVNQSINAPAQVEAIVNAAVTGKVDKVGGTASNLTLKGTATLNDTNLLSGVTAFTNGVIMTDGVLNGTNGVYFTQPGDQTKYWILIPPPANPMR